MTAAVAVSAAQPAYQEAAIRIDRSSLVGADKAMKMSGKFDNLRSFSNGFYEFSAAYAMPKGTFFGGVFDYNGGSYYSNLALVPTETPLKYSGVYYAKKSNDNLGSFSDQDNVKKSWNYFTGWDERSFNETSKDGMEITQVIPASLDVFAMVAPKFVIGYDGQADTASYYSIMAGGTPIAITPEGVSNVETSIWPYNRSLLGISLCPDTYYGNDVMNESTGETYSQYGQAGNIQRWGAPFMEAFGEELKTSTVTGYYTRFEYSAPYALSSVSMMFLYNAAAEAELKFDFYRMDGDSITNQVLYSYTAKVPAGNDQQYTVTIPFTSIDEYDEELSYMLIDCPMFMEVRGVENFGFIAPVCCGYDPNNVNAHALPEVCGNILNLYGDNQGIEGVLSNNAYWIWTRNDGKSMVFNYFDITVEAEYPNLVGSRYIIGEQQYFFDYQENGNYCVDLAEGEDEVFFVLASSAEYADEVFVDDSECPEWLNYEVQDYYQKYLDEGLIQRGIAVRFNVSGGYAMRQGHIDVEYKGKKISLYVGQDGAAESAGLDKVVTDNGKAEYFDLQGRKLQGTPANGLYLQRRGNKVSKVIL